METQKKMLFFAAAAMYPAFSTRANQFEQEAANKAIDAAFKLKNMVIDFYKLQKENK